MAASAMREDVMIRLSGSGRLAVLLAVVVAVLSPACARDVAEPTPALILLSHRRPLELINSGRSKEGG